MKLAMRLPEKNRGVANDMDPRDSETTEIIDLASRNGAANRLLQSPVRGNQIRHDNGPSRVSWNKNDGSRMLYWGAPERP